MFQKSCQTLNHTNKQINWCEIDAQYYDLVAQNHGFQVWGLGLRDVKGKGPIKLLSHEINTFGPHVWKHWFKAPALNMQNKHTVSKKVSRS